MRAGVLFGLIAVTACTPGARVVDPQTGQQKRSTLDFEYCQRIARETFDSGGVSYNLCPGYMPDGQEVELP